MHKYRLVHKRELMIPPDESQISLLQTSGAPRRDFLTDSENWNELKRTTNARSQLFLKRKSPLWATLFQLLLILGLPLKVVHWSNFPPGPGWKSMWWSHGFQMSHARHSSWEKVVFFTEAHFWGNLSSSLLMLSKIHMCFKMSDERGRTCGVSEKSAYNFKSLIWAP